jgi:hypothetical protein
MLGVIIANAGILLWGLVDKSHEDLIETLDMAVLWFFVIEIAIRFKSAGWRSFRDGWLLFDVAIIAVALTPVGVNLIALRIVRVARLTHFGRHFPHLSHLRLFGWLGRRINLVRLGLFAWLGYRISNSRHQPTSDAEPPPTPNWGKLEADTPSTPSALEDGDPAANVSK